MPDPAKLRDSTQIILPADAVAGFRAELEEQFVVTLFEQDDLLRIIGSPVEIKAVSEYLTRQGISLP